ncbi:MAG: MnmC family methyltransferase [Cyanobacteriota bacterium]|nr:MnmC family methyltransferase [Cyanobacteriota bacterium]
MTWPGCVPEHLAPRRGGDGSFSLWNGDFREGFHSGRGALREARETFLAPSQLERFPPGTPLKVVEVCVGTGTNLAVLLEACAARSLHLEWWGLELDPRPLQVALEAGEFRQPWQPTTLLALEQLLEKGAWQGEGASCRLLWGDARHTLGELLRERRGQMDLVWHDAFSPQRCPQLWSFEVLKAVTELLAPEGRWISYCSAAAVRETLGLLGLHLVALEIPAGLASAATAWSGGTLASFSLPGVSPLWRQLTAMERDHLASAAGEPYRDPSGTANASSMLQSRLAAQTAALACGARTSSSAWRRRWGLAAHR